LAAIKAHHVLIGLNLIFCSAANALSRQAVEVVLPFACLHRIFFSELREIFQRQAAVGVSKRQKQH